MAHGTDKKTSSNCGKEGGGKGRFSVWKNRRMVEILASIRSCVDIER